MALASEWPTGEGQVKSGGRETTHPSCAPVTWQVLCQGGAGHTAGPAPMAPVANHAASPTSGRASVRDPSGDRGGPAVVCEPRGGGPVSASALCPRRARCWRQGGSTLRFPCPLCHRLYFERNKSSFKPAYRKIRSSLYSFFF